jgi:hypothetical protein
MHALLCFAAFPFQLSFLIVLLWPALWLSRSLRPIKQTREVR